MMAAYIRYESDLLRQAEKMIHDGADFIDIGGYSSRPGAEDISHQKKNGIVSRPAIKSIKKEFPRSFFPLTPSVSQVAHQAINEGCDMINDISCRSIG